MAPKIVLAAAAALCLLPQSVSAKHQAWCGTFFVTGYVDRGLTASGVQAGPGIVAVDPRLIPLRSYVRVSGIGKLRAMDTGGAILGMRLDVWVSAVSTAYAITGYRRACVL